MKKNIIIVCLFIFAFFVSGCKQKNDDTIKFTTWGSQEEIEIVKPIIEKYNKTHDIKVELIHIPQNYFQKLHLLFASNLAPDVIFINNLYLPVYQKADLFEDLTPYINKDDYFENALLTLSKDEKLYAIPRDVSSMVIFYNKDFFKTHNIKINKSWTYVDFENIVKESKKHSDYGYCTELSFVYWENFISTQNKPVFLNEKLTINEKKSIDALQKLADSINKDNFCPKSEQLKMTPCLMLFLQEKTPFVVSGRWSVPKLERDAKFNYGVLPFPDGGSSYYIPLNASGWAVYKNSKHKKEAIDFVKYLSSDENIKEFAKSGLIIPAKKDIAKSNIIKNGEVFINVIDKSSPNLVPKDYKIQIDKLEQGISSVFSGYKTAKEVFFK